MQRLIRSLNLFFLILIFITVSTCNSNLPTESVSKLKYEANWESLQQYTIPDWFQDAKFGIFIHWGPYSVPAYGSEWYPRLMYMDSSIWNANFKVQKVGPSDVYQYHVKNYDHPGKFGYKDFIPMFTGKNFNAEEWMDLFVKAGAKYIVPVAEHHDGFAMYHSKHTRWNAVDMGPKRDVLKDLFEAARNRDIKTGASSHYAFNWAYFNKKPEFDNSDPAYADLYGPNSQKTDKVNKAFRSHWWERTKDIIDNYQPDILWFDFYLDKEAFRPNHPELAAYYYNKGVEWDKEVVLQNKNFGGFEAFPPGTNVLDLERGKMSDIRKETWQTDTSIGKNSWGYVSNWVSKTPNTLVDDLVDIVSKNGCLLLNVGPKSDGTIPEDQQEVLLEIGRWLKINGAAIYGTRPWKIYGEGPTTVAVGHHTEGKNQTLTHEDFRFTAKDDKLYAIAMDWSENGVMHIRSLAKGAEHCKWDIMDIKLLGSNSTLEWTQDVNNLTIELPEEKPGDYAFVFEINFGKHSKEAIQNYLSLNE